MTDKIIISGFVISFGFSLFMLFTRKKQWFSAEIKALLLLFLIITGLVGFIGAVENSARFLYYSMLVPPISFLIDRLFRHLSIKLHKRDFYLYLKGSDEIDDSISGFGKNKHIKASDVIFSFGMFIIILFLTIMGSVLFGKDNLYSVWVNYLN